MPSEQKKVELLVHPTTHWRTGNALDDATLYEMVRMLDRNEYLYWRNETKGKAYMLTFLQIFTL